MTNKDLITHFYTCFQQKDPKGMCSCYAETIEFEDPAFGKLTGSQVCSMWTMLIQRGGSDLKIEFHGIEGNDIGGKAHWQATYLFGKNKRRVVNEIDALFVIRDGKIVQHIDHFSFWKWSRQALGTPGLLLGWTNFLQNTTKKRSRALLEKYMSSQ